MNVRGKTIGTIIPMQFLSPVSFSSPFPSMSQSIPAVHLMTDGAAAKGGTRRYTTLDTLRGFLLVMMALNHIPSTFHFLTQQPFGFMTAAEGFVFLAGLVVGLVYSRRWRTRGAGSTSVLLLKRGWMIYKAHLATVLAIYLWMFVFSKWTGQLPVGTPWVWFHQPEKALLATVALLHQPGLLDVLPTYCGLLLITPLVMWQLFKSRLLPVVAISAGVWVLTNFIDPPRPTIIGVINTGAFNFGAWQFLYVIGVAIGHLWASDTLPSWKPKLWQILSLASAIILLSICSHLEPSLGLSRNTWFLLTNKNNLAPLRLFNVGLIILLIHGLLILFRREWDCPPLSFLGRHSLVVFSSHCVVALMIIGLPHFFESTRLGLTLGPLIIVGCMFATAALAEKRTRQRKAKTQLARA